MTFEEKIVETAKRISEERAKLDELEDRLESQQQWVETLCKDLEFWVKKLELREKQP